MGTVTVEFIGLFLFNASNPAAVRIAVIDADRDEVDRDGKTLNGHKASFIAQNVLSSDWPVTDDDHFELAGSIAFETSGPLDVRSERWALPRIATGCPQLHIDDSFFTTPSRGSTHAVIALSSGELCGWRFPPPERPGAKGAINTRVTIANPERFAIKRAADRKHIELDVTKDSRVVFTNTELQLTQDDRDWYWYYIATRRKDCASPPDDRLAVAPCDPPEGNPLSLGCSNSQWP